MLYDNILETIGNTPLVRLNHVTDLPVYAKVERFNPGGSVKDRAAYAMLVDAEKKGELKKGMKIIEPTSGNTGIALAMIGRAMGYDVELVMPESMSIERRQLMKAYGATLILTDKSKGMQGAVDLAKERLSQGNYYMPNQFVNPSNASIHEKTTGQEIIKDVPNVKGFIAGIGTGGTVTGVGRALKSYNKNISVWGLEPEESPILSSGTAGSHGIQGIGANFVPEILDTNILNKVVTVSTADALNMARRLASEESLLVGISSGANVVGAIEMAKTIDGPVVTVLPDTGERYLSTVLFEDNV